MNTLLPNIVKLPFGEANNEIATVTITGRLFDADIATMPHDRSTILRRQGNEIILRTLDPDHIGSLKTQPTGDNVLIKTLYIPSPEGGWDRRHIALAGVSVNLCHTEPESGRLLGIANVPSGAFTEPGAI